jgi:hypothetical protein
MPEISRSTKGKEKSQGQEVPVSSSREGTSRVSTDYLRKFADMTISNKNNPEMYRSDMEKLAEVGQQEDIHGLMRLHEFTTEHVKSNKKKGQDIITKGEELRNRRIQLEAEEKRLDKDLKSAKKAGNKTRVKEIDGKRKENTGALNQLRRDEAQLAQDQQDHEKERENLRLRVGNLLDSNLSR